MHAKPPALNDVAYPGVLALGTRLLAYVTTSESPNDSSDTKHGEESDGGGGYQDLAKGVAKEVFGGVKMLGNTLGNVFFIMYLLCASFDTSPRLITKKIILLLNRWFCTSDVLIVLVRSVRGQRHCIDLSPRSTWTQQIAS
jgi:hypothetical protein